MLACIRSGLDTRAEASLQLGKESRGERMVCVGMTDATVEWDVPCNMSACDRKQGVRACKGEGSSKEHPGILTCLRGML